MKFQREMAFLNDNSGLFDTKCAVLGDKLSQV